MNRPMTSETAIDRLKAMFREAMYWHVRRPLTDLPYRIAAKMPRWLVYHCAIRCAVHASGSKYPNQSVPELTVMDMLKRWEKE